MSPSGTSAGFVLLHFYSKKRRFKGEIALLYAAWYGAGRAWIEGLRTDSLYIGSVPRLAAPRYHQLHRGGRGARAAVSPN